MEADPLDLTAVLAEGENVIGVEVLYYSLGDGTYPMGKPGFLFNLEIETREGGKIKSAICAPVHLRKL